jgi:hypothetical protein
VQRSVETYWCLRIPLLTELSFTDECQFGACFCSWVLYHCTLSCYILPYLWAHSEPSSDWSLKYGSTMHLHVFHIGEKLRRYYFPAPFIELLGFQYGIRYHFLILYFLGLLDYSKWLDYWSTFCNDTISIKHDVIYLMSLAVLNHENDIASGP